jgi:hypothetical protein
MPCNENLGASSETYDYLPRKDHIFELGLVVIMEDGSKQKGDIAENRIIELITYTSNGNISCYRPVADDDEIDIILNEKGKLAPLFIQVKSRFLLNKKNRFIQNVGINTFTEDSNFYLCFILFSDKSLDIQCLWLIPSFDFKEKAYLKSAGETYKSFYRFSANPDSEKDQCCQYQVTKEKIGHQIIEILNGNK